MALIVLATVIDGMDASVVNVVLPDMAAELGMTVSSSAFVSVAYLIPIAGLCLALSKVADCGDIRRMFAVGTTIFMAASVGCAQSPGHESLIFFRLVQGLGAAFMVASTPKMVVRLLPRTTAAAAWRESPPEPASPPSASRRTGAAPFLTCPPSEGA